MRKNFAARTSWSGQTLKRGELSVDGRHACSGGGGVELRLLDISAYLNHRDTILPPLPLAISPGCLYLPFQFESLVSTLLSTCFNFPKTDH